MTTRRAGFTLVEALIAAALGGLVLAFAVRSLGELTRGANLDRSKHEAQTQAAEGLQKVSAETRAASIFFYAARPMAAQVAPVKGWKGSAAPRESDVPLALFTGNSPGGTRQPPGDADMQTDHAKWSYLATAPFAAFRFTEAGDNGKPYARLGVAPARRTGDDYDDFFPGPLAYYAKADFPGTSTSGLPGDASNPRALLPKSWTFSVLYLAPMNLPDRDANVAEQGQRDDFPPPLPLSLTNPHRTALPLALRLMTIPGVLAGAASPGAQTLATGDAVAYDAVSGRAFAPGATAASPDFLDPPYDYVGGSADAQPNYDPICIPMGTSLAALLDPVAGPTFHYTNEGGVRQERRPSGPRIAGAPIHANFNMLGNDPPTEAALERRVPGAAPITDRVLASYIDPDSVAGTSVRFVNNMREPPGVADGNGAIAIPATGQPYRRYIPAYGSQCSYLENRAMEQWGDAGDAQTGAYGALPKRALISLAIRYRTRKDLPFQFAHVSKEVDLDGVEAFAHVRPRRHS